MFAGVGAPRWVAILFPPLVAVARFVGWVCRVKPMAVLAVIACAGSAHAAGTTIPERQATLCQLLGAPPGCTIVPEPGLRLRGTLTLIVGESTTEPGTIPAWAEVHTSGYTFKLRGTRGPTLSVLSIVNDSPTPSEFVADLQQPPCLDPACVQKRAWDASYTGPTEQDLQDEARVLAKVSWQIPDPSVATALRAFAGATGIPYVAWVRPRSTLFDGRGSPLPTTRAMDVMILFASGAR